MKKVLIAYFSHDGEAYVGGRQRVWRLFAQATAILILLTLTRMM